MCILPIKSKLIVFADDTTLFADGSNPEAIIRTLIKASVCGPNMSLLSNNTPKSFNDYFQSLS
jgi:hypothetical protein